MKINIIIDTGDEQFEVMLIGQEQLVDPGDYSRPDRGVRPAVVRAPSLVELWNRGRRDADTWVEHRIDPLASDTDQGQHIQEAPSKERGTNATT